MRLELTSDLALLRTALGEFVNLCDVKRWTRRIEHLQTEYNLSPSRGKSVGDYHWLELELGDLLSPQGPSAIGAPQRISLDGLAALYFAHAVVEVHRGLSSAGRTAIEGRIRDSLKAESGFASLYLEVDVARRLCEAGCEIEFADIENKARYDLRFWNGKVEGEVECKSISMDAGRKVHRKDFYRFIDAIGVLIAERAAAGVREVMIVTVDDRLPAEDAQQGVLRAATMRLLANAGLGNVNGPFFSVSREPLAHELGCDVAVTKPADLYEACRRRFGDACHVSGAVTPIGVCLVVVRSKRVDDHSAPQLAAMTRAASQFSGSRPAFIAIQYDDITPQQLMLPHVRRRAGILSSYLFGKPPAAHVVCTHFCIYGGLSVSEAGTGTPAFSVLNPRARFATRPGDYPVFVEHMAEPE